MVELNLHGPDGDELEWVTTMIRERENFIAEIRVFLLCHFYEQPVRMNHFRFCPFTIAEKSFRNDKTKSRTLWSSSCLGHRVETNKIGLDET